MDDLLGIRKRHRQKRLSLVRALTNAKTNKEVEKILGSLDGLALVEVLPGKLKKKKREMLQGRSAETRGPVNPFKTHSGGLPELGKRR